MDNNNSFNNFNNDINDFEPQRPFTETEVEISQHVEQNFKNEPSQQESAIEQPVAADEQSESVPQEPVTADEQSESVPQEPVAVDEQSESVPEENNQAVQTEAPQEHIPRHYATVSEAVEPKPVNEQPNFTAPTNDYGNFGYYGGNQPYFNNQGYPAPPFGNPQVNAQPPYYQPQNVVYGSQPYGGRPPVPPVNNFGAPYYSPYQGYPQPEAPRYPQYMPPASQKKRANGGLVAIIIILSALLVLSFAGLMFYIATNGENNIENNNGYSDIPSFTIPNQPFNEDKNSSDSITHDESDYSDKIIADFSGIKLNKKPADADDSKKYNSKTAAKTITQSVVGIVCYDEKEVTDKSQYAAVGSGIIVTKDGYVVTNSHVIGDSKTAYSIRIVTADGKSYKAGVVGFDTRTDLAVLKMDNAKNLVPANFCDSSEVVVGEDIIAAGNPGGLDYQNSITKGVVSALDRDFSKTNISKYIQIDAPINPGNSGGPITNYCGQVIGVATSKIVVTNYEGMGFAIPSDTVKSIVDSLIKYGYVKGRVKIGISGIAVDAESSAQYNLPEGIYVEQITQGGPCDGTALVEGDIIIEADGTKITSFSDIYKVLEKHKPGDKIKLKYYRQATDKSDEIEITLQEDK